MITELIDRVRWGRNTLHLVEFFVDEMTIDLTRTEQDDEVPAGTAAA